ncbi:uncharacterized protein BKA78DRAFT_292469 [Phyllosticta capitalensis]|uniref:uncharacterized protein n=1 Tax=Phyllosticta capitalensis TaxID=121624 RepID=UPI0031300F48
MMDSLNEHFYCHLSGGEGFGEEEEDGGGGGGGGGQMITWRGRSLGDFASVLKKCGFLGKWAGLPITFTAMSASVSASRASWQQCVDTTMPSCYIEHPGAINQWALKAPLSFQPRSVPPSLSHPSKSLSEPLSYTITTSVHGTNAGIGVDHKTRQKFT